MRHILDSTGIEWTVFEVRRQGGSSDRWSYLPEEFGDGWLCFESTVSKRRLTPVPVRWREFSDNQLAALLSQAQAVKRPKGSADGERKNKKNADRDPPLVRCHASRLRFLLSLSDRAIVLLDILLVRRRHVARTLE
jgi:hypothetical protein